MLNYYNLGGHDYHYYVHNGTNLLLTFSDCEYGMARAFINSLTERNIQQLSTAIGIAVWDQNLYNVQNDDQFIFLLGQAATQEFINSVGQHTTFFGLVNFDIICVSSVAFYPFHDSRSRLEIEVSFGPRSDFHLNHLPTQNSHHHQV